MVNSFQLTSLAKLAWRTDGQDEKKMRQSRTLFCSEKNILPIRAPSKLG